MSTTPAYIYDQLAAIRAMGIIPPATFSEWHPIPIEPIRCERCQCGMVQGTKRAICQGCDYQQYYGITLQAAE